MFVSSSIISHESLRFKILYLIDILIQHELQDIDSLEVHGVDDRKKVVSMFISTCDIAVTH